jgi:hypothetical protein
MNKQEPPKPNNQKPIEFFDWKLLGTLLVWELLNIAACLLLYAIQSGAITRLWNALVHQSP